MGIFLVTDPHVKPRKSQADEAMPKLRGPSVDGSTKNGSKR